MKNQHYKRGTKKLTWTMDNSDVVFWINKDYKLSNLMC